MITIVPVGIMQVGCCVTSAIGALGAPGDSLILISADGNEIQPSSLVTVYL